MLAISQTKDTTPAVRKFVQLVSDGIASWLEAGKLVADEIDKDNGFSERLCAAVPGLTEETVLRFEAIGRGHLWPQTLLNDRPGMRRLRGMPLDLQKRFCNEPIEVLCEKAGGGLDCLKIDVQNLTPNQAAQVFNRNSVRSIAAQRAYLESKRTTRRPVVEVETAWKIVGKKIHFKRDCTMTVAALANIVAQIES